MMCNCQSHEVRNHLSLRAKIFQSAMQLDASMFSDDVLIHIFERYEEDDGDVMALAVTFRIKVNAEHRSVFVVRVERTAASDL